MKAPNIAKIWCALAEVAETSIQRAQTILETSRYDPSSPLEDAPDLIRAAARALEALDATRPKKKATAPAAKTPDQATDYVAQWLSDRTYYKGEIGGKVGGNCWGSLERAARFPTPEACGNALGKAGYSLDDGWTIRPVVTIDLKKPAAEVSAPEVGTPKPQSETAGVHGDCG